MDTRLIAANIYSTASSGEVDVTKGTSLQEIGTNILLKFIDVIEGVGIILIGLFLVKMVKRYIANIETAHERQRTALNLLEKIVSGFLIVITFMLGLKMMGLDLTLIVGVLTLGLSFGMRDVIKNYVAGLLILFKSPFEIGDVVKIRSFIGKIETIEFQAIAIRTFENKVITIHNSDLLTQPITNYSKAGNYRLEIVMRLGYGSDVATAMKVFEALLDNHPKVLKSPKYSIMFKSFSDHSMQFAVRFWVQKPCNILKIKSELGVAMQQAIDEQRLFAPYAREASLNEMYGMNDERRGRLQTFYAQPLIAQLAMATAAQVASATPADPNAVSEYMDIEEPE